MLRTNTVWVVVPVCWPYWFSTGTSTSVTISVSVVHVAEQDSSTTGSGTLKLAVQSYGPVAYTIGDCATPHASSTTGQLTRGPSLSITRII